MMNGILPEEVKLSFLRKGINTEEALTVIKTDMGREEFYCDAYTVLTREGLASLFCTSALRRREDASIFSQDKTVTVLEENDYCYFPLEEINRLKVEEQVSILRLVVEKKNGEDEIVLWASNSCRKSVFRLTDGLDEFLKSGEFPKENEEHKPCCPRCGEPYHDAKRRICKKCDAKGNLVHKIIPFLLRYKLQMSIVMLMVVLSGVVSVVTPYLKSKVLYDEVLTPGNPLYGHILLLVSAVAGTAMLSTLINIIHTVVGARVATFVSYDLKKTIFSSFERLSYSFFTSRHTGRLITQINSDADTLYNFLFGSIPYFLTNILQILGIVTVMFIANPLLTALVLIPIPFVFFGYWIILKVFRRLWAENHKHRSRYNGVLSDVLNGMRIVKSFSREEAEVARFDEKSSTLAKSSLRINLKHHTIFPVLNMVVRLTAYVVWGVGSYFVLKESLNPGSGISYGELNMFVSYLTMLYTPLNFFANFFNQSASGFNAFQRLFEILDTPAEVKEKKDPVELTHMRGEVSFEQVNFSYVPGKKTIHDVTFHVPAGETLGIVGHTGAGKSTLANLLTRLYDPDSGRITIDGVDIRDLSFRTLRKNVAIVSQETYLFRGSIMDNIRYADPEATKEDVLRAAKAAGCHEFIMSFPDGYETLVGFDKKSLSGGEKQRISIARAILKDPAILILDEATAAMDTKTERKIQQALAAITKDRTTITIAHRLSTLRDANSLIVIGEGKLLEEGTHETLLQKEDGVYRKLYQLQMEALKTIGIEE